MCDDVDGAIGERDLFFPVECLSVSLYKIESFLPGVSRNTCHAGVFEMPESLDGSVETKGVFLLFEKFDPKVFFEQSF